MATQSNHDKRHQKLSLVLITLSCALLMPLATLARVPELNGLPSSYPDTRETVAQQQYPWRSIGSLSIAGRQFCTATLISETQVITAAHCVWNEDRNNWYPASFVHFLAGYDKGKYLGHSAAASITPSRHYLFTSPPTLDSLRHDWALITLKKPLGETLGFIPLRREGFHVAATQSTQNLQLAGYRQDRPEVLSVAKQCQRVKPQQAPSSLADFLIHSCEALSGDSGGPLLSVAHPSNIKIGDVFVEGIHVGRQHNQSRSDSLAITAQAISAEANSLDSKAASPK